MTITGHHLADRRGDSMARCDCGDVANCVKCLMDLIEESIEQSVRLCNCREDNCVICNLYEKLGWS